MAKQKPYASQGWNKGTFNDGFMGNINDPFAVTAQTATYNPAIQVSDATAQQYMSPSLVTKTAQAAGNGLIMGQGLTSFNNDANAMDAELTKSTPSWADSTAQMAQPSGSSQPVSYLGDAWKGTKDFLGITPDAPKQTYQDYLSKNGGTFDTAKGMQTEAQFNENQLKQGYLDNQQFANYAGAGMGAVQTGLGVLNYFDQKAMNKKNSQLIDQQIVNNQDIMGTRKARAADITKYFG